MSKTMSNKKATGISLVFLWLFLALGCDQQNSEAPKNLLEGQKRAMDKASAVEDQLKQTTEQRDSFINQQSR